MNTKEHRSKIGLPVTVENIRTGAILEYGTMTEAANALGVTQPRFAHKKIFINGRYTQKNLLYNIRRS
ncbi:MAG: hypothetical protein JWR59_2466 [Brevundimonas sp.]|nr:hypothetical protein [Brevundimonas sp.]